MSIPTPSPVARLRGVFRSLAVLCALGTGLVLAVTVQGAVHGPRWLLFLGLPLSALTLAAYGRIAEDMGENAAAAPLRSDGPRAFAPAVVNKVRAVDRASGRTVADGRSVNSAFAFDLTVVADGLPPYRVEVRHPLDLQGLLHRSRAVVEYDPEQPWRVVVPQNPPRAWLARAEMLTPPRGEVERAGRGGPAGLRALVAGAAVAAVLLVAVAVLG
ncbi:hypothetical protein ACFCV8_12525 [Streptomyces sp. NPDC056347]|uniref:hypothetical protein n=1 Tax=Streptomyces sp. NPDC056347 TaxID=3345790 RepID=UPI0035D9CC2F